MKVIVDTNVLVRTIVRDDPAQAIAAMRLLDAAEVIVLSNSCLCELVWVLSRTYRFRSSDVVTALETLAKVHNVLMDRPAFDAGLLLLRAGGDFADGIIAHEGVHLGGDTFVSFDRQAVALLARRGMATQLLTG